MKADWKSISNSIFNLPHESIAHLPQTLTFLLLKSALENVILSTYYGVHCVVHQIALSGVVLEAPCYCLHSLSFDIVRMRLGRLARKSIAFGPSLVGLWVCLQKRLELLSNHRVSSNRYNSIEFIESNSPFWAIEFVSNHKAKFDRILDDLIYFL